MIIIKSSDGFEASVLQSLKEIDPNFLNYPGLLLLGTHSPEGINLEKSLALIKKAREEKLPTLGICFGLQMAVVEFARNVLNLPEANSEELNPQTPAPIIIPNTPKGGVRAGLFLVGDRHENHWHKYKFNLHYLDDFALHFWIHVQDREFVEEMRLAGHPFYHLTQYHPEYDSRLGEQSPHPVLRDFITACKNQT
jgi:CTP synthase